MMEGRLTRVCTLRGHEERVWSISWRPRPDGSLQLASTGTDRMVRIWGLKPGADPAAEGSWALVTEVNAGEKHSRTIRSVAWSPNGDTMVLTSFDATTSVWQEAPLDPSEGVIFDYMAILHGHENEVKSAAISSSGQFLATCSRDKSVWIYQNSDDFEYECVAVLQSHSQDVKMVKWHPVQDILFSCSYDDTIKVWGPDGDDWCCKETLSAHENTVWSLAFDAVGSRFATCSDDTTVRIWAPAGDVEEKPEPAGGQPAPSIAAAAFASPLFKTALGFKAQGGGAEDVKAVEPEARKTPKDATCVWEPIATLKDEHPRPVYSVDWMPYTLGDTHTALASACGDNFVRVFQPTNARLTNWTCVAAVEAHYGDANCVAWCPKPFPDGKGAILASAGDDNEVVLWKFSG